MENSRDLVQDNKSNCLSCRITGAVTFSMVATYFFFCCKHVKPVYYVGTPSMMYLAVSRAFDFLPFGGAEK